MSRILQGIAKFHAPGKFCFTVSSVKEAFAQTCSSKFHTDVSNSRSIPVTEMWTIHSLHRSFHALKIVAWNTTVFSFGFQLFLTLFKYSETCIPLCNGMLSSGYKHCCCCNPKLVQHYLISVLVWVRFWCWAQIDFLLCFLLKVRPVLVMRLHCERTLWNWSEKVDHLAYKYWCVLQGSGSIKMIRNLPKSW